MGLFGHYASGCEHVFLLMLAFGGGTVYGGVLPFKIGVPVQ